MPEVRYGTLHPMTAKLLDEIGVPVVTQGGVPSGEGAESSRGFHDYCGKWERKPFGVCFDLPFNTTTKALRDKLVAAGICVFPRYAAGGWTGSQHVHCTQGGLPDDSGKCAISSGPRQQIVDFTDGRNGLAGHAIWVGKWLPVSTERYAIWKSYADWVPDIVTRVVANDRWLVVYAWLEGKQGVFCEARRLVEGLGERLLDWHGDGLLISGHAPITLTNAYISGDFLRVPVRDVAEALGWEVAFRWAPDRASCVVNLTKAVA